MRDHYGTFGRRRRSASFVADNRTIRLYITSIRYYSIPIFTFKNNTGYNDVRL